MIVDIHAHYFPKPYNDALLRIGGRSLPEAARSLTARTIRNDDPSGLPARLQQMDDAGVQMQILSPAASPPYAEKEADAVATARLINDAYAELARKHPGRFNAVVSLPMPHIDASLREMERGLDQLGMLGVSMTCSCFDRSTAEAEFEPLYQEMNRRRAVLNYHPIQNGICSPMINDYGFTVSVGASLEDAAIVLHVGWKSLQLVVPRLHRRGGDGADAATARPRRHRVPPPVVPVHGHRSAGRLQRQLRRLSGDAGLPEVPGHRRRDLEQLLVGRLCRDRERLPARGDPHVEQASHPLKGAVDPRLLDVQQP